MVKSITALAAAAVFAYNVVASPSPTHTFPIQSGKNDWDGYNKDAQTSFSIPTAASAAPTAAGIAIEGGKNYVNYSTVGGLFLQDLNTTNPNTFNYMTTNFGLINQSYPGETGDVSCLTQWERFNDYIDYLNYNAAKNVVYKLLFIGRHGEGYHNAAQTYYGTPAWNCYYSELDGNATVTWADAHLDSAGIEQAIANNLFWASLISTQGIKTPETYYTSPLTRCLQTANYTYSNLSLPKSSPFLPTIKELFREGISTHTCDHRSNKTYIHNLFPTWKFESTFTETDEFWNGVTAETSSAQDYRSKIALDEVFGSDKSSVISITTHSGEGASLLRVLGHRAFSLVTGAIIPVLVRAEVVHSAPPATTTVPWATSAWCTNGPPVTSLSTAPYDCVCSAGVSPTAFSPPVSYASATPAASSSSAA